MSPNNARALRPGDRVVWGGNENDAGTVAESANPNTCILIDWDYGERGYMHPNDMEMVSRSYPVATKAVPR